MDSEKILSAVAEYIGRHSLLSKSATYLVAVSGGADSVALLLILKQLGYDVEAVHCNFRLRGDESYRDEQFVAELCSKLDVTLHRVHFDTFQYAELHRQSIELAARNLRYGYFEQLRNDIGAAAVCVAHHRDDVVETVLMNLVRGAGIHGMVGIRPRNGNIIRPLLCVCREDIETYLAAMRQDYVTDSTNLEDDATRNVFRHHVVPLLQKINPGASDNIAHTARLLMDVESIFDSEMARCRSQLLSDNKISVEGLLRHAAPATVLYELLSTYGFTGIQVAGIMESVAACKVGKLFHSVSHTVAVGRDVIEIGCRDTGEFPPMRLPVDSTYILPDGGKMKIKTLNVGETGISKIAAVATLDAGKILFPLTVRRVQTGDRFRPFGMKGTKLVSDFMTDMKCSYFEKQKQLVVVDADGQIIWLVGRRTSDACRITPVTQKVLYLEIMYGE